MILIKSFIHAIYSLCTVKIEYRQLLKLEKLNVNNNRNDSAQQQASKMIVAHLHLSINMFTNTMKQPDSWTKLPDNLKMATKDL